MAEKTNAKKATAAKAVKAPKAAAEKKVAEKVVEKKAAAPKKACATKKVAAKATTITIDAINCGYRAGDVYQALAKTEKGMTVAEIAKEAKISTEEVYLGIGWLFKEGKVKGDNETVTLA